MPFNPAEPSAALFGVIPQAYSQMLATRTGDPTVDAINALNLGMQARGDGGSRGYLDAIRESNQLGAESARHEIETKAQGDLDVAFANNYHNYIKAGASGSIGPGAGSRVQLDRVAGREADVNALRTQEADNYSTMMTGAKAGAEAGVAPMTNYIRGILTPPSAEELIEAPQGGYISPKDQEQLKIDKLKAEADMVSARKPNASNGNDGAKSVTHYIIGRDGQPTPISVEVTDKNSPKVPTGPAAAPVSAPVTRKFIQTTVQGPNGPYTKLVRNPAYKGQ